MPSLVIIPTYNEVENLPIVTADVLDNVPETDILIIDDNSTDGTSALADHMCKRDPRIHVMHRTVKDGLGRAYLAGFAWAIEREYSVVVEMDADGSHPATSLQSMLDLSRRIDLVIGSRYMAGGATQGWSRHRELLSRCANYVIGFMLHLGVHDATSGFRAYRVDLLERLNLDEVDSAGYAFQIDMTRRAVAAGATLTEHPITFREREFGESKMNSGIILEAGRQLMRWWANDTLTSWRRGRVRALLG